MKAIKLILFLGLTFSLIFTSFFANAQNLQFTKGKCNVALLEQYEADFDKIIARQTAQGSKVSAQTTKDMNRTAWNYIKENEKCFSELARKGSLEGTPSLQIDDGGVRMNANGDGIESGEFLLGGTKWGANSPFLGGQNRAGPGTSGGIVTYSFIGNGVSNAVEGVDNNLRISSLPTYSSCFDTEIIRAFAMWSAVANIQFQQVSDNGVASNASGASGDIRIGSHSFDGRSGVLAHAFFPPPNGNTIAGDLHFDRAEQWTCDTSGLDIGIVATHEIGHSIGLRHEEQGALAIMNPFYNPGLPNLTTDDINGARSIYGANGNAPEPEEPRSGTVVAFLDDLPIVIPLGQVLDECSESIGSDPRSALNGTWSSECLSRNRSGSFARFYNFTLTRQSNVFINLTSNTVDTFLYLLNSNMQVIDFDDDGGSFLNSRIQITLPAGRYIIEATTFSVGRTGNFSLNVSQ